MLCCVPLVLNDASRPLLNLIRPPLPDTHKAQAHRVLGHPALLRRQQRCARGPTPLSSSAPPRAAPTTSNQEPSRAAPPATVLLCSPRTPLINHYGRRHAPPPPPRFAEIWDALKAAATSDDPALSKAVLEAAEVKVMRPDMSVSYDPRGFRYELPPFVLADPSNLAG